MRVTKFGHACVRVEHDGVVLVLDPGSFTEPEAVEGADVVLVTHEHPDHLFPDNLRRTDAPVVTIEAVAARVREDAPDVAERLRVVTPGASLDLGVPVRVVGERHAVIHPEFPRFDNSGYLLDLGGTTLFHPGDALTVPETGVDLLCLPISAPWLKVSEALDFARAVGAPRNLAVHDRIYTDVAQQMFDTHFARLIGGDQELTRLADGADWDL